jgi:hypothetical protein
MVAGSMVTFRSGGRSLVRIHDSCEVLDFSSIALSPITVIGYKKQSARQ